MGRQTDVEKAYLNYEKARRQEFLNSIRTLNVDSTVSEILSELKEKYGVTKAVLADMLNVDRGTITNWEKNNDRVEYLYWIALGIKREYNFNIESVKFDFEKEG